MRGDYVIVRASGGRALVKRVWSVGQKAVYITNDEQLEKLMAGQEALFPIGFPKEDVFEYRPEIASNLASVNWSELPHWKPLQASTD